MADVFFPAQNPTLVLVAQFEILGKVGLVFRQFLAREDAVLVLVGGVEGDDGLLVRQVGDLALAAFVAQLGNQGLRLCCAGKGEQDEGEMSFHRSMPQKKSAFSHPFGDVR